MSLTSPNCPAAQDLPIMVENAVSSVAGVKETKVEVVWDPPWDPSRMSDEARLVLNIGNLQSLAYIRFGEDEMATARPRPQVMRLTDAAASRIKSVMAQAGKPVAGVRVGVKNGGCAGMEYTMEYADAVNPTDEIVEDKGVKLLIDPKAVLFLLGTEMDYKTEKLSAQFVFNNPNQTSACGCGESVQLTPAKAAD